jgi:hypothetical protein
MKYCPNADCPYAQKFKRPGEYRETIALCSDCGAALVDAPPASLTSAVVAVVTPSDANQRLAVTIGAGLAFWLLSRFTLLGAEQSLFGLTKESTQRMLAVGMAPFATAFVLVEVMALLLPPLRALRVGGAKARSTLDRTAWLLGCVLLVLQLFGVVRFASTQLIDLPAPALMWAQFLVAHAAMLALAAVVSRFGLGNGFGLLMAVGFLDAFVGAGRQLLDQVRSEALAPLGFLAFVAILGATCWLAVRLGRAGRGRGGLVPSSAPFPVSSAVAWTWAGTVLALPATLSAWMPGLWEVQRTLQSSQVAYDGLLLFVACDVALGLGFLFFRPRAVGAIWARWVPGVDETGVVAAARALLPASLAISVGVTVGLPFLVLLLSNAAGVVLGGMSVIVVLTISCALVDIVDEWSALRRLGRLISVWEVQRTAEVEPLISRLKSAGIEAHARSFLLRATQQFFTPWIPVSILVPAAREAEARALLTK